MSATIDGTTTSTGSDNQIGAVFFCSVTITLLKCEDEVEKVNECL